MSVKIKASGPIQAWDQFETILLDMDGTLLDLAFDNYFWRELIPRVFARQRNITEHAARQHIFELYSGKEGTLDWYCLDFWGDQLELDLVALKTASSHRICFLPGARQFLNAARTSGKRLVLVTNAHQDNLNMKKDVVGLSLWIDEFICSHDLGAPKEHQVFWKKMHGQLDFEPARTLFVDDSHAVLDAAASYGIGGVVGVRCPDSRMPAQAAGQHHSIASVADWL